MQTQSADDNLLTSLEEEILDVDPFFSHHNTVQKTVTKIPNQPKSV